MLPCLLRRFGQEKALPLVKLLVLVLLLAPRLALRQPFDQALPTSLVPHQPHQQIHPLQLEKAAGELCS